MQAHSDGALTGPWQPGPPRVGLAAGELHVWLGDLDAPGDAAALSPVELARAAAIRREPARSRWIRSRWLLRVLLARYTGGDPAALPFAAEPSGRPRLVAPGAPAFSLAHAGATALVALWPGVGVGADVEVLRRRMRVEPLARRLLGQTEASRLTSLEPALARRELLRRWCLREARLKHGGEPAPGWVAELELPHALGAVALDRPPDEVRLWLAQPPGPWANAPRAGRPAASVAR